MASNARRSAVDTLVFQCRALGLPWPALEVRFYPVRRVVRIMYTCEKREEEEA